jgi:hypothetical protein
MSRRLTFGVELEFSLATLADEVDDPIPSDQRPVLGLIDGYTRTQLIERRGQESREKGLKKKLAQALRDDGLPAVVANDPDDEEEDCLNLNERWNKGHWVVTTDVSIHSPYDQHDWWPIEVNSPPYIFCKESLDAVRLACTTLTSKFRLNVNETCGLHVHVGNGNDNFSLTTIKNFFAFLWCFEPAFEALHPEHRIDGAYYTSLRRLSRLGRRTRLSNLENVLRILQEPDRERLLRLVDAEDPSDFDAYNARNLRLSLTGIEMTSKVTIEFRQHESTLDGDRVINWVKTVVGLLEFADNCDPFFVAAFVTEYAFLMDAGEKNLYMIVDLLRDIGLDGPATYYESMRPDLTAADIIDQDRLYVAQNSSSIGHVEELSPSNPIQGEVSKVGEMSEVSDDEELRTTNWSRGEPYDAF